MARALTDFELSDPPLTLFKGGVLGFGPHRTRPLIFIKAFKSKAPPFKRVTYLQEIRDSVRYSVTRNSD